MRRRYESRYAPRHGRRRSKEKVAAQNRLGAILIGASVLTIALIGGGFAATYGSDNLDRATGCRSDHHAPAAHTLVLVDATDSLDATQIQRARSLIQTEYMWLPMGGQLTVRSLNADPADADEIVICRVDDGSGANPWTQNPKHAKQRFEKTVGARLHSLYATLENAPVQSASPILEEASRAMDRPDFASNVGQRRLVIFSDFAQHSALASQYGKGAALREVEQLERPMGGVRVRLHYIERSKLGDLQTKAHRNFWTDHFRDMGADVALGTHLLIGEDPAKETWIG